MTVLLSAPRGLGGISSLGGGGKPLPNLLGKSLDKAPLGMSMGGKGLSKAPLGGLKGVGVASSLDSLSGSVSFCTTCIAAGYDA